MTLLGQGPRDRVDARFRSPSATIHSLWSALASEDDDAAAGAQSTKGFVDGLLRVEGVVVERLDGIDDLAAVVREFEPGRGRRLGVLVDDSRSMRIPDEGGKPDRHVWCCCTEQLLLTST